MEISDVKNLSLLEICFVSWWINFTISCVLWKIISSLERLKRILKSPLCVSVPKSLFSCWKYKVFSTRNLHRVTKRITSYFLLRANGFQFEKDIFLYLTGQGQMGFSIETQPFSRSPNGKQKRCFCEALSMALLRTRTAHWTAETSGGKMLSGLHKRSTSEFPLGRQML